MLTSFIVVTVCSPPSSIPQPPVAIPAHISPGSMGPCQDIKLSVMGECFVNEFYLFHPYISPLVKPDYPSILRYEQFQSQP